MSNRKKRRGAIRVYGSYMFRGKDPAIDQFRTVMQDYFETTNLTMKHCREIEKAGGAAAGTVAGWLFGDTNKPQNPTLEASGRAMGKARVWVDARDKRFTDQLKGTRR